MAHGGPDAQRRATEGARKLGDAFLDEILLRAEGAAEIASEARVMAAGVTLMPISA